MSSYDNLLNNIEQFKNTYYADNKKNVFFKKNQKLELASKISEQFDIDILIQQTIHIVHDTNRIYINYPLFKVFANPDNYRKIIDHVLACFKCCLDRYGDFECHFNLSSFTISAAKRYRDIIEMFCKECLKSETRYGQKVTKLIIYHSPGMIENMTNLFLHLIDPHVRDIIILHGKNDSDELIHKLLN